MVRLVVSDRVYHPERNTVVSTAFEWRYTRMSIRWMIGLFLFWVVAQLICSIGEGLYEGTPVVDQLNDMTAYKSLESQGILALPIMGAAFFSNLPKMLAFDYSFFEAGAGFQIIRILFMAVTFGVVYGILQAFWSAFQGIVSGLFRL